MRETCEALMRSMPRDAATRPALLVETPFAAISDTAAITALSTRE